MKVSPDRLELAGEVVESRMTSGFLYIKDELGSANYPGALNLMGIQWPIGQRVRITIEKESVEHGTLSETECSAIASSATHKSTGVSFEKKAIQRITCAES